MSILVACVILLLLPINNVICKRMWDYALLSIDTTTSDPTKFEIDAEVQRISRTEYGFSLIMDYHYFPDDTTFIVAGGYRSNTGNEEDYVVMPWSLPTRTYEEYIKSFYESIVLKNLEYCSNLPAPDKAFPVPKDNVYKFDRCVLNGEGMPEIVPDGYYKVFINATGEVDWTIIIRMKISRKTNLYG
ncbi:uncharacterized protein LOC108594909 [Drosophila busckii]|uniref:uncharacterized protein LOC108594909 n=1 Tax=Drosophila busckii TaxID=30019 RepID=UPI00083EDC83|nr:uncharacterized protein LOC108594909 [Drosophila busckii]